MSILPHIVLRSDERDADVLEIEAEPGQEAADGDQGVPVAGQL